MMQRLLWPRQPCEQRSQISVVLRRGRRRPGITVAVLIGQKGTLTPEIVSRQHGSSESSGKPRNALRDSRIRACFIWPLQDARVSVASESKTAK